MPPKSTNKQSPTKLASQSANVDVVENVDTTVAAAKNAQDGGLAARIMALDAEMEELREQEAKREALQAFDSKVAALKKLIPTSSEDSDIEKMNSIVQNLKDYKEAYVDAEMDLDKFKESVGELIKGDLVSDLAQQSCFYRALVSITNAILTFLADISNIHQHIENIKNQKSSVWKWHSAGEGI
jgi:predicted  nucleic acid-binding Zn-ribbon protein